ncbi:MAG TPA: hypothetical protein PKW07_08195 [Syntrophorhabdaceae bacterium]|nr:hypothetical protein [Syntrophorhabdaceae bacterium]
MLPRRHILDVWEFVKDEKEFISMATINLAIDAVKFMEKTEKRDHLVEALELNEFICYMFPMKRPGNRSLLFHVISDLIGLLMYGVPRKTRHSLEIIETINYSEKSMRFYPVIEVWNALKEHVYKKKHGPESIIDGFIKKIKIEMDIIENYPFVEEVFFESKKALKSWLPSFSRYYDKKGKTIQQAYDKWWDVWKCKEDKESILKSMLDRLRVQAETEYDIRLDTDGIFSSIMVDNEGNRSENNYFSRWYKEGVNLLLKI